MDLIYMNDVREDVGVLIDYNLDLAFGEDENDFAITIPSDAHCCEAGFYLYYENTEYGGIIDEIQSDTETSEVSYRGRTWHGILNSKILEPDSGQDHLVVSGEANAVLESLIQRVGLSDLFIASTEDSGIQITSYKMNRYVFAYDGIRKMLAAVEGKLRFTFQGGRVILSAHPRIEYTSIDEIDSDRVDFKAVRHYHPVNHLICLGRGELAEREVIHLYADADGKISKRQTFFGLDERMEKYENSNAESLGDLEESGVEELKKLAQSNEITVSFSPEEDFYEIQDLVSAVDNVTGIIVVAEITKKIVTLKNDQISISYKVGV